MLPEPRWRGLRLVAVDSITLRLPNWLANQDAFGVPFDSGGQPYVLARALGLFATTSRLMLKATLAPLARGERALLASLLPHLAGDDLLIMDRGFPGLWLFTALQLRACHFLARRDGTPWPAVVRTGRISLDLADHLGHPVDVHRQLGAEVALAVPLRPGRIQSLLPPLVRLPVGRHRVLPDQFLVSPAGVLPGRRVR